jgi:hypothetical protein
MAQLAPVVLFVYNRLSHTKQTVEALLKNELAKESELFIFSDGPKSGQGASQVEEVRSFISTIQGFKAVHVVESKTNLGLSASVIAGVTKVLEAHEKVIVLEDDLITSTDFLTFMNKALDVYESNWSVYSISGYTFPSKDLAAIKEELFLYPRPASWGWATWKNRWQKADWDMADFPKFSKDNEAIRKFIRGGEDMYMMLLKQQNGLIQSWAIRWAYTHFVENAYSVYLRKSKVKSIGTDSSGTNLPTTKKYDTEIFEGEVNFIEHISANKQYILSLKDFYKPSLVRRCINTYKFGWKAWLKASKYEA